MNADKRRFNAAFWRWFGDSKVVDANGEPLVVYHATEAKRRFGVFKTHSSEMGAHFGTLEQAMQMGKEKLKLQCYLSIKNPLRLRDEGNFFATHVWSQLRELGFDLEDRDFEGFENDSTPELQAIIESAGYDGIVYLNRREISTLRTTPAGSDKWTDERWLRSFPCSEDSWIAFHPEQIKAVNNRGTWDPRDPDIRHNPLVTWKRSKDFADTGMYLVTVGDRLWRVGRDPESGAWFWIDAPEGLGGVAGFAPGAFLGYSKADAQERLIRRTEEGWQPGGGLRQNPPDTWAQIVSLNRELDSYLTFCSPDRPQSYNEAFDPERFLGGDEWYLGDGGYSRMRVSNYGLGPLMLTGNSTPRAKARWTHPEAQELRLEIERALETLRQEVGWES